METVDLLVAKAAELVTCRGPAGGVGGRGLGDLELIRDGAVAVRDGRIVGVGPSRELERRYRAADTLDAAGRTVTPGLVDPHTHLLHAGSRHDEWEARVVGAASAGIDGGIRSTVQKTRAAADEELAAHALADLDTMLGHGTTTVEAKTGYGLTREEEVRLLRLTAGLSHAVDVVPTFLGAHVLPADYLDRRDAYVALVIEALADVASDAEYCDVCCDPIGFSSEECRRIAAAAAALGLRLRVHADQTGRAGGLRLAAELHAASADHLDFATEDDIRALADSPTVGVLLPGVAHHMLETTTSMPRRARALIDSDARLALATDYNPGTCPTPSMQAVMQLAARLYRLSYAEIWHMSTLNAAAALDRAHDRGSLEPGKRADIVVWAVPEHGLVINRFGVNLAATVIKDGEIVVG